MAINYTSEFSGLHNDQYDDRINALLSTINSQQETISALTNRISSLESSLSLAQTNITAINSILTDKAVKYASYSTTFTSSTSLAYTGLTFTIPAGHWYVIEAIGVYHNHKPVEITINTRSTDWNYQEAGAYNEGIAPTAVAVGKSSDNSSKTFYIWARYVGSSTNSVIAYVLHGKM